MKRTVFMLLALVLAACASSPTIDNDYAPGTDFSRFRTYNWLGAPQGVSPLVQQRILSGVDAQLQAKGWQRVDSGGDVAVAAHVATQQQQSIETFYASPMYSGWGRRGGWGMNMGGASTTVRTYNVGTLVVDMFDASTKQAFWRGSAQKTVPSSQAGINEAIDTGIARMFAGFPPGSAPAR
jgi:hypothetical protein